MRFTLQQAGIGNRVGNVSVGDARVRIGVFTGIFFPLGFGMFSFVEFKPLCLRSSREILGAPPFSLLLRLAS